MSDRSLTADERSRNGKGACTRRRFLQAAAIATTASGGVSAQPASCFDSGQTANEKLFWGDLHTHTALSDGNGEPEDHFEIAKSHLDFWAMADHAYDKQVFDLDYGNLRPGRRLLNDQWEHVQTLCRDYEAPGRFIPILGYEWTNFRYGHHNVYYREYDQPIRMPPTLPQLYASLKDAHALAIPHHPGYPVGVCGKDWRFHDERLSPFVEIYSLHGSSETTDGVRPLLTGGSWMGPGGAEGCVQAGLAAGYKLGIMASSDSHGDHPGAYDLGLIAAYAPELTRRSLWRSFHNRRVYAVTGDRIRLDFSINGHPMGGVIQSAGKKILRVGAVGWDKIERVEIIKNNTLFHAFTEPATNSPMQYPVRLRFFVQWGWDSRAENYWSASLTLNQGKILQAAPCFRGNVAGRKGTGVASLSAKRCQWTSKTEKVQSGGLMRRFADAIAFEVECPQDDRLQLNFVCGPLEQHTRLSPDDILNGSALKYMEEIPSTNNGAYWHSMKSCAKFKVHQGWPTSRLTLNLTCEDDAPPNQQTNTDFYYVRLVQRNGQRAWSSPIWVEHG